MNKLKIFFAICLSAMLFACSHEEEYDMLNSLWRNVTQTNARIDALEEWCKKANTNITSIQTIIEAQAEGDVITAVIPVLENGVEVGYTIAFANQSPITIYHGKDGKNGANGQDGRDGVDGQNGRDGVDGQNGTNGQDGITPVIGAKKDTDGIYYWTINGEWLLDENGNKLRVTGADGKNGVDGTNGQDGVTPQLKIENGYWYVSYNNGATWNQLGKATGDKGEKGDTGLQGPAGDSSFQSVTQDANNVYFVLADGTTVTVAKLDPNASAGKGMENGHEWVDLGLPSGTLWASEDVNTPSGNLFAWGETISKASFSESNYLFKLDGVTTASNDTIELSSEGNLLPKNDVAHTEWGGKWRIPTAKEFEELANNCTIIEQSNPRRMVFVGPNGNMISIKSNEQYDVNRDNSAFFYWTSSIYKTPINPLNVNAVRFICVNTYIYVNGPSASNRYEKAIISTWPKKRWELGGYIRPVMTK